MRDVLISGARPKDLDELIDSAVEIDNYQGSGTGSKLSVPFLRDLWIVTARHLPRAPSPCKPSSSSAAGSRSLKEEPMHLGHARLTTSERCRRSSGSCLYCGQGGQFIAKCPTWQASLVLLLASAGRPPQDSAVDA